MIECFKCGKSGHWSNACPDPDGGGGGRGGSRGRSKTSTSRGGGGGGGGGGNDGMPHLVFGSILS